MRARVGMLAWCVAWLCVALVTGPALGAGVVGGGSVAPRADKGWDPAVSHGWVVATDGRPSVNVVVLHLPPRAGGGLSGARAAGDGTVRSAAALTDLPLGIAAVGDSLYMTFQSARNQPSRHRVVSVRAVSVGAGALWTTSPAGRMTERPMLDQPGRIAGLSGTGLGVAALVVDEERPALMLLDEEASPPGWRNVTLPEEVLNWRAAAETSESGGKRGGGGIETPWTDSPWRLVGGSKWIGVLAWRGGDDWTLWRREIGGDTSGTDPLEADAEWTRVDVSLGGTALAGIAGPGQLQFGGVGGELIAMGLLPAQASEPEAATTVKGTVAHPKKDAVIISRRIDTAAAWRTLARVDGATDMATLVSLDGVGRLVVFWEAAPPPVRGEGPGRRTLGPPDWRIAELSASSGEVFYSGKLKLALAGASADYRAMGVIMLGVLVGAVLFVIVPVRAMELVLPEGTSLATPGRRLMATAVDGFLALLAASVLWDVPLTQVFGVDSVLTGKMIEIVGTALAIAIPIASVMEAGFGRSPGKALLGIEVVRMSRGESAFAGLVVRPSLVMCLVRNAIKWIMPPVAMLGLLDPELRHRGDVLSRSAVVVKYEDEAEDGEQP